MQRVEKVIEIDAPIERVFGLFSDFENFPRWMRHIRDVHYSGRGFTRWTADAPLGTSVEWEAETTDFDPPHRIAWESVRGDIDTEGDVTFRETRRGTTLVRVRLAYSPPAGRLGAMVASLFGNDPEQQLEEDLLHFAEVAERGRRPQPPARPRERYREPRHFAPEREFYDRREGERYEQRGFDGPERRYEEEERRLDFDSEWDERLGRPLRRREERAHRHALTPRERERERAAREPDYGYTRDAFRRGVDRLMDEPPSRGWRRWD